MPYYDDLSGDSSEEVYSSDGEDEFELSHRRNNPTTVTGTAESPKNHDDDIWKRSIVHLDIDCFYCQCEEIDRNLRQCKPPRPLAIGQKHIIVTCNYEARRHGVKKLQLRDDAYAACPNLWIVEGSDLQRYRRHSRKVYEAFREALALISVELFGGNNNNNNNSNKNSPITIPARKGTMDEMMADLTPAVSQMMDTNNIDFGSGHRDADQALFLYGETEKSSRTVLVEDQTGQEAVVSCYGKQGNAQLSETRRNVHEDHGSEKDRQACAKRLLASSRLVTRICQHIRQKTGFHTTGGISVSPLLAKIASDLNKPKSVNVLYPWRSSQLIYSMPLRKMNSIGYGTVKALKQAITSQDTDDGKGARTVRDLLELPRNEILKSIQGMQAFQSSSEEKCNFLIDRCRGLDSSEIVDDEGGAQKTLSIENSFRRGTVRTMEALWRGLLDLFVRLPLLLRDRASWSCDPDKAYPTTIRLTVRLVDKSLVHKRRPFVTNSKQAPVNGKELLKEKDPKLLIQILKRSISPLLTHLLQKSNARDNIDVTRINIALTNFQDIHAMRLSSPGQASLSNHFQPKRTLESLTPEVSPQIVASPINKKIRSDASPLVSATWHHQIIQTQSLSIASKSETTARSPSSQQTVASKSSVQQSKTKPSHRTGPGNRASKMKPTRIDHFFWTK